MDSDIHGKFLFHMLFIEKNWGIYIFHFIFYF